MPLAMLYIRRKLVGLSSRSYRLYISLQGTLSPVQIQDFFGFTKETDAIILHIA